MGVLEGRVCPVASLLATAVLDCSLDFGDLKNLKDHLLHLLDWQGIVPHSVFSRLLLLVLGDMFQNIIDLLVEKYFLICSLLFC